MKVCSACRETLPLGDFYRCVSKHDGRQSRCKKCDKLHLAAQFAKDPERFRRVRREKQLRNRVLLDYPGVFTSREDYEQQRDVATCRICGGTHKMSYDHDHVTGVGRDWLCGRCNSGLGMFQDDPERLRAAAAYLERHSMVEPPPDTSWIGMEKLPTF